MLDTGSFSKVDLPTFRIKQENDWQPTRGAGACNSMISVLFGCPSLVLEMRKSGRMDHPASSFLYEDDLCKISSVSRLSILRERPWGKKILVVNN